jgi:hypothetical protein
MGSHRNHFDNAHLIWMINQGKMKQGNYMSLKMIANGKAREHIEQLKPFRGSNLWGEWTGRDGDGVGRFVVYSYRYTFPLYVYDQIADQWYENHTQFSSTTSRHRNQCRPTGVKTINLGVADMEIVAREGGVGLISRRVE